MAAVFGSEFAAAEVEKSGNCKDGYSYQIKWDTAGDKASLQLNNVAVTGLSVSTETITINDGGLLVPRIRSQLLAKPRFSPQVHVYVRSTLADCADGLCFYNWSLKKTMVLESLTQVNETTYELTGGKFSDNTVILVGGVAAAQTSRDSSKIIFEVPEVSGKVSVKAFSDQAGFSTGEFSITVKSRLSAVSPSITGIGGGQTLKFTGKGFNKDTSISINSEECKPILITYDLYACESPAISEGTFSVFINDIESDVQIQFEASKSASLEEISVSISGVSGGDHFSLTGSNFGTEGKVQIGTENCEILSWSDTEVSAKFPPMSIGSYDVKISTDEGFSSNSLSVDYKLEVYSTSPEMSSVAGGAMMTIKGFGFNEGTTVVKIGESDCKIEEISESEVTCRASSAVKEHIIVNGMASISGQMVNSWTPRSITIALGERVTWKWNIPLSSGELPKVRIQQTVSDGRVEYNGVGFQSKMFKAVDGSWSYDFLVPGTYFYSSGFIESTQSIALTGVIVVADTASEREVPVNVFVGNQEAIHVPKPEVFSPNFDTCQALRLVEKSSDSTMVSHTFSFDSTPVVKSISPKRINPSGIVTIRASGLAKYKSCLSISIGGYRCRTDDLGNWFNFLTANT